MSKWVKAILGLNLAASLTAVAMVAWVLLKPGFSQEPASELHSSRAAVFEASALYKAAAQEYQAAAEATEGEESFNYWLKAGDLCYDKAMDYMCAAQSYLAAKSSGKAEIPPEAATRLVNSLKNLGKTAEAQAWLNDLTALNPKPGQGATVAARMGEREITLAELKASLDLEPPEARANFEGKDGLKRYLNYFLFSKLLYEEALKDGMLDETTNQAIERFQQSFLSQRYYQKNLMSKIEVSDKELKEYYDQNPAEFKDAAGKLKPFNEVKSRLALEQKKKRALTVNDLWLYDQIQKRGIKINEQAFAPAK